MKRILNNYAVRRGLALLGLFVFLILALPACVGEDNETKEPSYIEGTSNRDENGYGEIRYFKDKRTDLCYAERGLGKTYTFTCVPCTKEVQSLIDGKYILYDK